jgi:hypothetical protein
MQKRIKPYVLVAAMLLLAVVIIGIIAYMTDNEFHVNNLKVKPVKTRVVENYNPPDLEEYEPGNSIQFTKEISAQNTGEADCYIRIRLEFSDAQKAKISRLTWNGQNWYSVEDFHNHLPPNWIYVDEKQLGGPYYYYTKIVHCARSNRPAESTTNLITGVQMDLESTEDITNDFDIFAYAEAIQVVSSTGIEYQESAAIKTWRSFLEKWTRDGG